jgi:hypothetical protein
MLSESPAEITIDTRNEDPHVFLLAILLVLEKIKGGTNVEATKLRLSWPRDRNVASLLGKLNFVLP